MTLGTPIRILLVFGWLGFYTVHALHYALPDLGLVERHDFAAVVTTNVGLAFSYDLHYQNAQWNSRPLGNCTVSLDQNDRGYELITGFVLSDPNMTKLAKLFLPESTQSLERLSFTLTQNYDNHLHMISLSGEGTAGDHRLAASGKVGPQGLVGSYRIDLLPPEPLALAQISQQTEQGLGLAPCLPAGLRIGDHFSQHLVTLDVLTRTARPKVAVFSVLRSEQTTTRDIRQLLLVVDMDIDGHTTTTMWCDSQGTVYRYLLHEMHLTLNLTSKRRISGAGPLGQIWPPVTRKPGSP